MSTALKHTPQELKQRFLLLKTAEDLAELLDVPLKLLVYHARVAKESQKYREFNIAKKSGTPRTISAPKTAVKILQRKLSQILLACYERPAGVNGFVPGKSILSNATVHLGARFVLNVDLKDYFPSINFGRVRGLFMAKPYGLTAEVATLVAQVSCNKNSLPQGAPSSPIISNMVCSRLDSRLLRLAQRFRCKYSRYADDLTFSTTRSKFPRELAHFVSSAAGDVLTIGHDLRSVIIDEGFEPNMDKLRLRTPSGRQEVTGLTINVFPNVRRKYINQLRAMLHAWEVYGYDLAEAHFRQQYDKKHRNSHLPPASFRRVIKGKIDFLRMVRGHDDPYYVDFARLFYKLEGSAHVPFQVGRHSRLQLIKDSLWVLETNEDTPTGVNTIQGTAFALAGVGIVTCSHTVGSGTRAFQPHKFNSQFPVTIVAEDKDIDLAIIAISEAYPVELLPGGTGQPRPKDAVHVWGFPNYNLGDTGLLHSGYITGFRKKSGIERILCDATIVEGNSGGPVLDAHNFVIGVAVTGAPSESAADKTENHGVIPISALKHLKVAVQVKHEEQP